MSPKNSDRSTETQAPELKGAGNAVVKLEEATLSQTLAHLLQLLPGRTLAAGLMDDGINLTLKLDPVSLAEVEPVLKKETEYRPYSSGRNANSEPPLNARILIVEDTLVARMLLRRTLEQLPGCQVIEATTGREALTILNKGPLPDLCISDLSMPEMDGLALLREIRATPTLSHLDVMLCTATTERETVLKAADLQVCRYLLKPYNPPEVKEKVRETIVRTATRQWQSLQDFQARVGLQPEAGIEMLRKASQQFAKEVSFCRTALATGKRNSATTAIQGLRGICISIREDALVRRLETLTGDLGRNDLTAILEGLESLLEEGKRLARVADRFTVALENKNRLLSGPEHLGNKDAAESANLPCGSSFPPAYSPGRTAITKSPNKSPVSSICI